ncbi:hypothetical protein G5B40_07200 [Pikeienuella piscinae]|uniref:Apolipoprotein acyltransferase n=1 Tax=Pikeienuella piscinae TaxID=2748098 RepID=A0A7L5C074_9RHOB|nr:hypothetical protein [Pikeienuella piscinae]QIE55259.1 hypothetical protein G5B40_07200 [Pikeienuella piscinae]
MLPLISFIIGLIFGWVRAARRGGGTADRLQYAIGHGVAFGIAGLVFGVILLRAGLLGPA